MEAERSAAISWNRLASSRTLGVRGLSSDSVLVEWPPSRVGWLGGTGGREGDIQIEMCQT